MTVPPFADDRLLRDDELDADFIAFVEDYARKLPGNPKQNPKIVALENLQPRTAGEIITTPSEELEVFVQGASLCGDGPCDWRTR